MRGVGGGEEEEENIWMVNLYDTMMGRMYKQPTCTTKEYKRRIHKTGARIGCATGAEGEREVDERHVMNYSP